MNKRKLYENIMNNVSRGLRQALNEQLDFENSEIEDRLFEIIKGDELIKNVVRNVSDKELQTVINGMIKLIKAKAIGKDPVKIKNVVDLANAILNRGFDGKNQNALVEAAEKNNKNIEKISQLLANEINDAFGDKKADKNQLALESKKANEGKGCSEGEGCSEGKGCSEGEVCPKCGKNPCQCEGKQCGESCGANQKVTEARNYKRVGGFRKYLYENNIRPGRKLI